MQFANELSQSFTLGVQTIIQVHIFFAAAKARKINGCDPISIALGSKYSISKDILGSLFFRDASIFLKYLYRSIVCKSCKGSCDSWPRLLGAFRHPKPFRLIKLTLPLTTPTDQRSAVRLWTGKLRTHRLLDL